MLSNGCPICQVGILEGREERTSQSYRETEKLLPSRYSVCRQCGSETADVEQTRWNKDRMQDFIAEMDRACAE